MPTRLTLSQATVNAFHHDLLRWYRRNRRDLPWRRTRDPYKIWISEVMLQQTRVAVVRDYYHRWLRAFPTVESLARAPYARVLKLWEGLGYYARAKNLHRAARSICAVFEERSFPKFVKLLELPGIGRYTAAAIASIAFDERVPVVDGNVARVLARIFCIRADVTQSTARSRLWSIAGTLLPQKRPGEFNQALMELGALVCTPAQPRCEVCPMSRVCLAFQRGDAARLPNRGVKRKPMRVNVDAALVRRGRMVLVRRRPARGLLAQMWELPALDPTRFKAGDQLLELRHAITNRRITLRVFESRLSRPVKSNGAWRWVSLKQMDDLALPAAQRRAVQTIFAGH
jgi:A/G-specific adenine glycosylase